jgi:probable DNA metabolism protein
METVTLAHQTDLDGFRAAARALVRRSVPPPLVGWRVAGSAAGLFEEPSPPPAPEPAVPGVVVPELKVPRAFLALAEAVVCHSDPERFGLLYRLLWRLKVEPRLMEIPTDRDMAAARRMEKSVGRDVHKMHAFVRFRRIETPDGGEAFVAWFEPEHFIEERATPFFARRFAGMDWTIVTPRVTAVHRAGVLTFGPGGRREDVPADASEALWKTYYASIFNPARLKVKAMTAEMPKKYWRNLPEAALIPELIAGAEARARGMIAAAPTPAPAVHERIRARRETMPAEPTTAEGGLAAVRAEAMGCRRCPLYRDATQTVFGEGPEGADVMFVGEQPGDREDLAGRPFVGPAGQVFDAALEEAGIVRDRVYVTNAVKHFKFEPRGKRRLHKKPNGPEIEACRWWLEKELTLVAPRLIVGMGGTALQSLLARPVKITELRGTFLEFGNAPPIFATVHPSYILRIPDPAARDAERARFVADLRLVAERLAA